MGMMTTLEHLVEEAELSEREGGEKQEATEGEE